MKLGPWEIALILVIVMIVFGVGKLPDIGRQLGKGIRDFKKYSKEGDEEEKEPSPDRAEAAKSELEVTRSKLEAAEAKVKVLEESNKKTA